MPWPVSPWGALRFQMIRGVDRKRIFNVHYRTMKIKDLDLGLGLVAAPIAGVSDLAFRLFARRNGADLVFTEMISSTSLARNPGRNAQQFMTCDEERPVAAQIFGADPAEMARAAAILSEKGIDLIDINMGCPARKVIRSGAGAALLRDIRKAVKVIQTVVQATDLPVTVKMRSGWDHDSLCAVDLALAAEDAGAAALTIHPRTKSQVFGGHSDWEVIREVKSSLKIPVIGNGDIKVPEDAERMFRETHCDGIMIGRAAMGNPWIFSSLRSLLLYGKADPRPDAETIKQTLLIHLRMEVELKGEKRGVPHMRKFAAWYSRGLPGAAEFRNRINRVDYAEEFRRVIEDYFSTVKDIMMADRAAP